jgi:tyrosinase
MHVSYLSAALAVVGGASALPSPQVDQLLDTITVPITKLIPALPVTLFAETKNFTQPVLPQVAKQIFEEKKGKAPETPIIGDLIDDLVGRSIETRAQCSNPRVRIEWESYPDSSRRAYLNAIKCLQGRPPSGQFRQSKSRYEDIVALHQTLTPNVHGNAKFLLWHRYYTWMFEDMLRTECGFNQPIPWFDETRYAGRFSQSSIFSSQYYGGLNLGGACVTNGQFANLAINIGPGQSNTQHCLSRNGDGESTSLPSSHLTKKRKSGN